MSRSRSPKRKILQLHSGPHIVSAIGATKILVYSKTNVTELRSLPVNLPAADILSFFSTLKLPCTQLELCNMPQVHKGCMNSSQILMNFRENWKNFAISAKCYFLLMCSWFSARCLCQYYRRLTDLTMIIQLECWLSRTSTSPRLYTDTQASTYSFRCRDMAQFLYRLHHSLPCSQWLF